jgi:methyltransferase (TIGR00027 family)
VGVALARALHQSLGSPPLVLEDPIAPLFFTREELSRAAAEDDAGTRLLTAHVVLRSRWAEERAAAAVARGCAAVVVLGAGLDSLSLRRPGALARVPVLEVDHPASQKDKRARLAAAGVGVPPSTRFVGVDFASQTLAEGLGACDALSGGAPAVFLCLGVIMYLARADIAALLAFVAAQPKGSELVLSFAPDSPRFGAQVAFHGGLAGGAGSGSGGQPPAAATAEAPPAAAAAAGAQAQAAAVGEPWLTLHSQEGLEAQLRAAGFSEVKALSVEEGAAFFGQLPRADGLLPPARVAVLAAVV